jgi:hypothetical protein
LGYVPCPLMAKRCMPDQNLFCLIMIVLAVRHECFVPRDAADSAQEAVRHVHDRCIAGRRRDSRGV